MSEITESAATSASSTSDLDTAKPSVASELTDASTRSLASRIRLRTVLQGQGLLGILIILVLYFTLRSPYFLTWSNIVTIGAGTSVLGIMTVAQTYLIISGGIDVSVGSVVAFSGVILGLALEHGFSPWVAIVLTLCSGVVAGALNGFIVIKLNVNPFITTLGTMSIFSGWAYVMAADNVLPASQGIFRVIGVDKFMGLPVCLEIFLVLVVLAFIMERFTSLGRAIFAIGGNREASRLAGLQVKLIPFVLYVASGLSASLAAIVITSQLEAASPQVGSTYLLTVVTAVILGGASLAGGRGSIVGTFIAVLILAVLQDGFGLLQLSAFAQTIAIGVALIIAVLIDQAVRRSTGLASKKARGKKVVRG
jgi:ribose transport system permease protein